MVLPNVFEALIAHRIAYLVIAIVRRNTYNNVGALAAAPKKT